MARRTGANSVRSLLSIVLATLPITRLSCRAKQLNTYYPNASTASETLDGHQRRSDAPARLRSPRLQARRRVPRPARPRPAERVPLVLSGARARVQQEVGLLRRPRRRADRGAYPRRHDLAPPGLAARAPPPQRPIPPPPLPVRLCWRCGPRGAAAAQVRWQRATDPRRAHGP